MPVPLDRIVRPTLLIDKRKTIANIRFMNEKAAKLGICYRPHFKTHQSRLVGRWHKAEGIAAITVSSVEMAAYFASEWQDITIAFPVNIREIESLNALALKVPRLNLLVESVEAVTSLGKGLKHEVGIFIKVDTGYHRTGIAASDLPKLKSIIRAIEAQHMFKFAGFLVHAGHSYDARGEEGILAVHNEAIEALTHLYTTFKDQYPELIISYGDTPTASVASEFGPVNELRPGNLAYYDVMQMYIGACSWQQIAVCMACPVVAIHPERNELVVYGGGVHLSKDMVVDKEKKIFGLPVHLHEGGWSAPVEGGYVKKLSQEHGVIRLPQSAIEKYNVGSLIGVLPVHSCLAVDCIKDSFTLDGEQVDLMA